MLFEPDAALVIELNTFVSEALFHEVWRIEMTLAGQPSITVYHAVTW